MSFSDYSSTLKGVMLQSGHKQVHVPKNPVDRDVRACTSIGQDALPHAICELYEESPSRDLWKGMLQEWPRQVSGRASGAVGHYRMKCCIDRLLSVKQICNGTISWWPTECPSYEQWYTILYPKQQFDANTKHQILCASCVKFNAACNCSCPNALAQMCWSMNAKAGRLAFA